MRLNVTIQRKILACALENQGNLSQNEIARRCKVSSTTVAKLLKLFHECGKEWSELARLPDKEFTHLLKSSYRTQPFAKIEPNWDDILKELAKPDVTKAQLYLEYCANLVDTPTKILSSSQFNRLLQKFSSTKKAVMHQYYRPAEKMFVDFCGRTVPIFNEHSATEVTKAQIFVATLGVSGCIFAYAVPSQKIESWLECHVQAFQFYGGVPQYVVCDNLKSAVIANKRDGIYLNKHYEELAEYFHFAIAPARNRKPQDKGIVEAAVKWVQRGALAALRNHKFFSIDELNQALAEKVELLNQRIRRDTKQSRLERFMEIDKPALCTLPPEPFYIGTWKYNVTVKKNYHICFEGNYYSVPYYYIDNKVDIYATRNRIIIYLASETIASHTRCNQKGQYITDINHAPSEHKHQYLNEPEQLLEWAKSQGCYVYDWVRFNLQNKHFANGYRAVKALRSWISDKDNKANLNLNSACEIAIHFQQYTFTDMQRILNGNYHSLDVLKIQPTNKTHKNVRGASYFTFPK